MCNINNLLSVKISGIPYGKHKPRGDAEGAAKWTKSVIEQTKLLPKVTGSCKMKTTFLLPPDKFPKNLPYGPDLDNLLKRFFDALNTTIFSNVMGRDSAVVIIEAMKKKVNSVNDAGVELELWALRNGGI
ncbi:MAG: RusA family crossover junction endodeoxyribonuclease [Deltaproteobacteria bacterium]|nr:RusA family crossover junction endodeoxyribonuclease [Deltaproteobacteria bacterium]